MLIKKAGVFVNVAGNEKISLPSYTKILGNRSNLNDFEFSTLNYLKEYNIFFGNLNPDNIL